MSIITESPVSTMKFVIIILYIDLECFMISSWEETPEQTALLSVFLLVQYNLSPRLRAVFTKWAAVAPVSSVGRIYRNCTPIYRICTAIEPKMHCWWRERSMVLLLNIMWPTILQSNDKDLLRCYIIQNLMVYSLELKKVHIGTGRMPLYHCLYNT